MRLLKNLISDSAPLLLRYAHIALYTYSPPSSSHSSSSRTTSFPRGGARVPVPSPSLAFPFPFPDPLAVVHASRDGPAPLSDDGPAPADSRALGAFSSPRETKSGGQAE